ncbi:MAG TPA: amidase family protein, partial [Candidatus Cloacimonas sp.]|nr:amidase family protein [Candidatus Cloacimonas sp.]
MNSAIDPDNLKELSLALRQGKLPLQDYIIQTLSYIEKREPVLGALLPEDNRQERLLKQAEELLLRFPEPEMRPPLFGILIGVKDLFNVDGLPTRAGSKLPPEVF